ncbi:MAG: CDP-glucose 4,6-dehydratase [Candidatus Brocadiae bacterium]|nr:CDP-glucose 4,6-dehydratase [Candidatus Brocadiia bacterium]
MAISQEFWHGKKVFITGHTGFKGSWLALWLQKLGANVCGYSLPEKSIPSHWNLLNLNIRSEIADIRDSQRLEKIFREFQPEIVFHLAAQALVRASYREPVETYSTNVMGTLHVFEACRKTDSVKAIVNVTSDKCYENKEWNRGYKEEDAMGGHDPYSSSKACSEILTASYRNSYFPTQEYGIKHHTLLASCRAGNVIGGGDWAEDRLIPDIMRSVAKGSLVEIRNPRAIRPWQHLLEPLSGYLLVARRLWEGKTELATGWNFGPSSIEAISVEQVVKYVKSHWDKIDYRLATSAGAPHEASILKLDCSKAHKQLGWSPVWDVAVGFEKTVRWYREFYEYGNLLTESDISSYMKQIKPEWGAL